MKLKTAAQKLGSLGGKARAKRLSSERRKEIASSGGKARALSRFAKERIMTNFSYVNTINTLRAAYEKRNSTV